MSWACQTQQKHRSSMKSMNENQARPKESDFWMCSEEQPSFPMNISMVSGCWASQKSWTKAENPHVLPRWHFWVGEISVTLLERITVGERQEVGPKGCHERLPGDLKRKKFCGRGFFFMLFQASPDNCLDKFTQTQPAFFRDGKSR